MFFATGGDVPVISHPRSLVVVGPGSQATVVESYLGHGAKYFTNAVTEIVAGDHSVVDHYKLQEEDERSFHVATLQVQIGRDANFSTHSISLGGRPGTERRQCRPRGRIGSYRQWPLSGVRQPAYRQSHDDRSCEAPWHEP